ncbi:hypothetical protein LV779_21040 [Streptomyces thinghirensis]|nr:hypothetical protein [Streptomyces thinghirensis]
MQANHRIDAGGPDTPTPFTAELAKLLEADGDVSFRALVHDLRSRMSAAGHRTVRGDVWEPESRAEPGVDVLLAARPKAARPPVPSPPPPPPPPPPGPPSSSALSGRLWPRCWAGWAQPGVRWSVASLTPGRSGRYGRR